MFNISNILNSLDDAAKDTFEEEEEGPSATWIRSQRKSKNRMQEEDEEHAEFQKEEGVTHAGVGAQDNLEITAGAGQGDTSEENEVKHAAEHGLDVVKEIAGVERSVSRHSGYIRQEGPEQGVASVAYTGNIVHDNVHGVSDTPHDNAIIDNIPSQLSQTIQSTQSAVGVHDNARDLPPCTPQMATNIVNIPSTDTSSGAISSGADTTSIVASDMETMPFPASTNKNAPQVISSSYSNKKKTEQGRTSTVRTDKSSSQNGPETNGEMAGEIERLNEECLELEDLVSGLKTEAKEAWDSYQRAQAQAQAREQELQQEIKQLNKAKHADKQQDLSQLTQLRSELEDALKNVRTSHVEKDGLMNKLRAAVEEREALQLQWKKIEDSLRAELGNLTAGSVQGVQVRDL